MAKKVSILIPTYNRPKLLPYAVNSALRQTIDCEVLVINDGGCELPKLPTKVRRYNFKKHHGAYYALNRGIWQATGDLIFNLDDDDLLPENAMERLRDEIEDNDVIFSDLMLFPSMIPFPQSFEDYEALLDNNTMPGVLMTTKEAAMKVPFPELSTGWDYERSLRFCEAGLKIKHLAETLYFYRQHPGQIQKRLAHEQTENNIRSKQRKA